MAPKPWSGQERRETVKERLQQEETAAFLAFFGAVIVAVCLMFNWDVTIHTVDVMLANHQCESNQGLKNFSKDSGGDIHVICNNGAIFDFNNMQAAKAIQEAKNDSIPTND